MKRLLSALLALAMLLALGTCALAADKTVSAAITYRGVRIVVDGTEITPCDASGAPVEPFIMDGTTYLPVRAIAGALGLDVSWNGSLNAVVLTSGGGEPPASGKPVASYREKNVNLRYRDIIIVLNGAEIMPVDANSAPVEPFIMDGTTYLPVRAVANALGLDVLWDSATSTVSLITVDGDYNEMLACERTVVKYLSETSTTERRYAYNSDGSLYSILTDDDGFVYTETYYRDASGRIQKIVRTGDSTGEKLYEYGAYDSTTITSKGAENSVAKYVYNSDYYLVQYSLEERDAGYTSTENYFYNRFGGLIRTEKSWVYGDGSKNKEVITYERDNNGLVTRETRTYMDGTKDVTSYTYNSALLVTLKRTVYSSGAAVEVRSTYNDWYLVKETVYIDDDLLSTTEYEYDEYGRTTKMTDVGDGYSSVTTYEYDSIYELR